MTAWIGSLGTSRDVRAALETSCKAAPGHGWDPAEVLDWWVDGPVAAHPKCRECVSQMRTRLLDRGLTEEQMVRALRKIGASVSVRKDYERKTFSEEDTITLGGKYTDWLKTRKTETSRPERKLGDSLEWVDSLTDEMRASNERLRAAQDEVMEQRAELIDQGVTLEEAVRRLPFPEGRLFVEREG